jgi:aspartate aminotransferase
MPRRDHGGRGAKQVIHNALMATLNPGDEVILAKPEGAFYVYASCAGLIGKRTPQGTTIDSDSAFCRYLLDHHDVAARPGSCSALARFLHLSYAAADQDLREAIRRIANACRELS